MNIGFVGVRFAGLDGVTLESAKIADVLRAAGHEVYWFAGELGAEYRSGTACPAARFDSADNLAIQAQCFGVEETPRAVIDEVDRRATVIRSAIDEYRERYAIDVLVPQNALSIPMQLSLAVALARLAEDGVPMVAHHHDFSWERDRFSPTGVDDVLERAFPPKASSVRHIVINSLAQSALLSKRGVESTVLPNVMDFENPPAPGDPDAFRRYAGVGESETLLLQATRVIPRKSIEFTLELAARLTDRPVKVVVTHFGADEGGEYGRSLEDMAGTLGVDYQVAAVGGRGQPLLADAYAAADLVTYPSAIEGFGNALLEAIYFGRPVLVNRYPVFVEDIAPVGLDLVEMESAITPGVVGEVMTWLDDPERVAVATDRNYALGREHFSYDVVRRRLLPLLD